MDNTTDIGNCTGSHYSGIVDVHLDELACKVCNDSDYSIIDMYVSVCAVHYY